MNGTANPLRAAHRLGYTAGVALCVGTPGLIAVLILARAIPPGALPPEGLFQQVGYLFTGLVFLAGAWVWWRREAMLRDFEGQPATRRPAILIRETILYSGLCEVSSVCGLVYWILVGQHATRHVWGFILLTPVLFLALVPRYDRWMKSLEGRDF